MAFLKLTAATPGVHWPPARVSANAHVKSLEEYKKMYDESINEPVWI